LSPFPSITVVTPCLNAAATIQETIDSVARQDYPGPVEHIVVDGGSTDGTLDIVRRAGLRHVSESDRGLSHALNKGLAMCRHEVFAELNADDLYMPGALERVGRAFAERPQVEWVTGLCPIIDAEGREIRRGITTYKRFFLRRWSFRLHLVHNFVAAPATFVRASALRQIGGFDERFQYSMDYDVWLKLGRRGPPVVLDEPLAAFRMAQGSLSLTGFTRQFEEHATNVAEHGAGYRGVVALNRVAGWGIVTTYRILARLGR
jgi:GT2 family glycosyltransferase